MVGSATHQLFTTSHRQHGRNENVLEQCSELAGRCADELYLAFISHPDDWGCVPALEGPAVYEWIAGDWLRLFPLATTQ